MKIYENLKRYRLLNNKKQFEVAKFLEIDESYYGKIERGEIDITWSRLKKLSELYKIPSSKLCDENLGFMIDHLNNSSDVNETIRQNLTNEQHIALLYKLTDNINLILNSLIPLIHKITEKV